jgi:homoserine kinase
MRSVLAFAPGTVANLGPGLDILGLALDGVGDEVQVSREPGRGISVDVVGSDEIPRDPARNTATIAATEILRRAGAQGTGLRLEVRKGLPLAGGQGGSAASAAAAAVATDALLNARLSREELLEACLTAEQVVSGRHADNAAAALYGGVVLVRSLDPIEVVRLTYPRGLRIVLARPAQQLATERARAALPTSVSREIASAQAAQVGALVAALAAGDLSLLARAVEDHIAEPARKPLLPGFAEAKRAALEAGARGCSISGAGPSAFAFAQDDEAGTRIGKAMTSAYRARGIEAEARVFTIDARGARVVSKEED